MIWINKTMIVCVIIVYFKKHIFYYFVSFVYVMQHRFCYCASFTYYSHFLLLFIMWHFLDYYWSYYLFMMALKFFKWYMFYFQKIYIKFKGKWMLKNSITIQLCAISIFKMNQGSDVNFKSMFCIMGEETFQSLKFKKR